MSLNRKKKYQKTPL